MRRISILTAIFVIASMCSCTPAPKYRSRPSEPEPAAEIAAPGAESRPLSVELLPPVKNFDMRRVTSPFNGPSSPRSGRGRRHDGIDIKAASGEEVFSAASGVVVLAGRQRGYGNIVIVDHGAGITTVYAHLFYANVRKGEEIGAGQPLGRAGKRGRATGVHLHFELRREGVAIDPVPYLWLDSGGPKQS